MNRIPRSFVLAGMAVSLALTGPVYAQSPSQQGYSAPGGGVLGQVEGQTAPADRGDVAGTGEEHVGAVAAGDVAAARSSASQSAAPSSSGGGSLPFTGLDLALLLGVGMGLLTVGLAVRRLSQLPSSA